MEASHHVLTIILREAGLGTQQEGWVINITNFRSSHCRILCSHLSSTLFIGKIGVGRISSILRIGANLHGLSWQSRLSKLQNTSRSRNGQDTRKRPYSKHSPEDLCHALAES